MSLTPNEIIINDGVHKYCESHQIYFSAHFGFEQCPMCEQFEKVHQGINDAIQMMDSFNMDYHDRGELQSKLSGLNDAINP